MKNNINAINKEKLVTGLVIRNGGAGSFGVPTRTTLAGKWTNNTAQISRIDIIQLAANRDFGAGSELIVMGHD